jgi:hypothetical protein
VHAKSSGADEIVLAGQVDVLPDHLVDEPLEAGLGLPAQALPGLRGISDEAISSGWVSCTMRMRLVASVKSSTRLRSGVACRRRPYR